MIHNHIVLHDNELEKSWWSAASRVAQQGSAGIQAKLLGNGFRLESPGRMNVAATVEMGANRGQPASQQVRVDQVLPDQLFTKRWRRMHRVMTSDDQASDRPAGPGDEISG
jgi:hypothetical protein